MIIRVILSDGPFFLECPDIGLKGRLIPTLLEFPDFTGQLPFQGICLSSLEALPQAKAGVLVKGLLYSRSGVVEEEGFATAHSGGAITIRDDELFDETPTIPMDYGNNGFKIG